MIALNGWGSNRVNSYQPGKWSYEIWADGELMIKSTVNILAADLVIKSMQFAGTITNKFEYEYGQNLYNDINYLRTRINSK